MISALIALLTLIVFVCLGWSVWHRSHEQREIERETVRKDFEI